MLTSSGGGGGRSMLTVADRGEGGGKICQNLADVICERSLLGTSRIVYTPKHFDIFIFPGQFLSANNHFSTVVYMAC